MISIDYNPVYDNSCVFLRAFIANDRSELLKQIGIQDFPYVSFFRFSSNRVHLTSAKDILKMGLDNSFDESQLLWKDHELSNNERNICKLFKKNNSKLLVAYSLQEGIENTTHLVLYGATNNEDLLKKVSNIKKALDLLIEEKDELIIPIKIYWYTSYANHSTSSIVCPYWNTIKNNYAQETKESLQKTISYLKKEDDLSGRLLLWHGEPGTGKTWAARSLVRELYEKYEPIVISDSDAFCSDISYYYGIIQEHNKPCLFIIEDSAENIISEARVSYGNRVSKLLNLTDGLMAQGRNDLFLVSFNESIAEIDPAFTRHGRCLSITEFLPLSKEEVKLWCSINSTTFKDKTPNSMTLAELYGNSNNTLLKNSSLLNNTKKIGF